MSKKKKLKVAINTGGGDAPGLNAVIRAATLAAHKRGWEIYGIKRGYNGLLQEKNGLIHLTPKRVRGITHQGGTILGTVNKNSPFDYPGEEGERIDVSDKVLENFKKHEFDCLLAVGGDGSLKLADKFYKMGMPVIGIPKTIDNDLECTVVTFGFDTAVNTATDAIDKLHSTAESHSRVMVVEVMGRYTGWIALNSGISGTADVILIPEIPFSMEKVCKKIMKREKAGKHFSIVVVAEGAKPLGGEMHIKGKEAGREVRLGGIGEWVAGEIERLTGKETRSLVLGHLQRGGHPTSFDRLLGLRFGAAAIRALEEGKIGHMVALDPPVVKCVPLEKAVEKMKTVCLDCDTVRTARDLDICLGD